MSPDEKEILLQMQRNIQSILELLQANYEPNNGYKIVLFLVPIFGIVFGSTLLGLIFLMWHRQRSRQGFTSHLNSILERILFFLDFC
jgi:hypothetical protein